MPRPPPPIFRSFGSVLVGLRIYSSLNYFQTCLNLQSLKITRAFLFKCCIIPGVQGYFVLSLFLLKTSWTFLFLNLEIQSFRKEENGRDLPAAHLGPFPSPAAQPSHRSPPGPTLFTATCPVASPSLFQRQSARARAVSFTDAEVAPSSPLLFKPAATP